MRGKKIDLRNQQGRRQQLLLSSGYMIPRRYAIQVYRKLCALRPDLRRAPLLIQSPTMRQGVGEAPLLGPSTAVVEF